MEGNARIYLMSVFLPLAIFHVGYDAMQIACEFCTDLEMFWIYSNWRLWFQKHCQVQRFTSSLSTTS